MVGDHYARGGCGVRALVEDREDRGVEHGDGTMKFVTVRSFPIARHGRRNERLNDNDEEEHADVADGVEPVHCEGLRVTHDQVAGSGGLAGRARPANLERPSKASHCRP
jgi:hypothetical protein